MSKFLGLFCLVLVSSLLFVGGCFGADDGVSSYITDIPSSSNNASGSGMLPIVSEPGIENINPNGAPLIFPCYNATSVTLTYAESVNYTLTVSSQSPRHHETSSPRGITFVAEGVDTFVLHYRVLYNNVVNQSITLTVISGNGQTTSIPLVCVNRGFVLDVIISTGVLPVFPSAEDIWNYGFVQQEEMLAGMQKDFLNQQSVATVIQAVIIGVMLVVIAVIYILFRHVRRQDRRLYRWEIRHRAKGEDED